MNAPTPQRFNRLKTLESKLGYTGTAIGKAIEAANAEFADLERLILPAPGRPLAEDASLVFFGSLARGEWTSHSDLDWVLLVDGQVDETHFRVFQDVRKRLRDARKIEP